MLSIKAVVTSIRDTELNKQAIPLNHGFCVSFLHNWTIGLHGRSAETDSIERSLTEHIVDGVTNPTDYEMTIGGTTVTTPDAVKA